MQNVELVTEQTEGFLQVERSSDAREASLVRGLVELARACNVNTEDEYDDLVYTVFEGLSQYFPEFAASEEAVSVARQQVARTSGLVACEEQLGVVVVAQDKRKSASAPGRVPC